MAILQASLSRIQEQCPNLIISDDTDYPENLVFPYFDFRFHDYTLSRPTINSVFIFSDLTVGSYEFTSTDITIETNGVGNIINPEAQYSQLASLISSENSSILAVFVAPPNTTFEQWYIRIHHLDQSEALSANSVTVATAGTILPMTPNTTAVNVVNTRNLSLRNPQGTFIDLGATSQVDQFTFSDATYIEGSVITVSFCGNLLTYTVTDDNDAPCVARGVSELIAADIESNSLFCRYVSPSSVENIVSLCSKEPGVPIQVSMTSTDPLASIDQVNTVANNPSMAIPGASSDVVTYETMENGGRYSATLTLVSDCDYNVAESDIYSWCFDVINMECCLVDLATTRGGCKDVSQKHRASQVRNILAAIDIGERKNLPPMDIQKIVDTGNSICSPADCGCDNC